MKTIKFRSPELAQAIQEYFPNISIANNEVLTFSEFDLRAFRLAIDLEGLKPVADYSFSESQPQSTNYPVSPEYLPYRRPQRPVTVLDICIYTARHSPLSLVVTEEVLVPRNNYQINYHQFRLLVGPVFGLLRNIREIPLVVNEDVVLFALFLGSIAPSEESVRSKVARIQQAACLVDNIDNPRECSLKIRMDGRSIITRFYPSQISLDVSHF